MRFIHRFQQVHFGDVLLVGVRGLKSKVALNAGLIKLKAEKKALRGLRC